MLIESIQFHNIPANTSIFLLNTIYKFEFFLLVTLFLQLLLEDLINFQILMTENNSASGASILNCHYLLLHGMLDVVCSYESLPLFDCC